MDYYQLIARVIEDLENYATDPISLSALSERYCLSRFHFTRVFHAVTHRTLKAYIDERRLNYAAQQLVASQRKVIEIALEAGYESHAAFTRRFRQSFGLSPTEYRHRGIKPRLLPKAQVVARNLKQIGSAIAANYEIVDQPAILLLGQFWPFNPEGAGQLERLAGNIQTFVEQHIIPQSTSRLYSLIYRPETIEDGLLCFSGYEADTRTMPPELVEIQLPAGKYAMFRYKGDMNQIFDIVFSDICLTIAAAGLRFLKNSLEFFILYESNYFQDGCYKIYVLVE